MHTRFVVLSVGNEQQATMRATTRRAEPETAEVFQKKTQKKHTYSKKNLNFVEYCTEDVKEDSMMRSYI
jgi:hypothetical protein